MDSCCRMSIMDQKKLLELCFIFILVSQSKGQGWEVDVPRHITAVPGSNVTIPCSFTYPAKHHTDHVQLYWKLPKRSHFKTNDKDPNAFIFHPNETFVTEEYRGRTQVTGNKGNGSCSLKIWRLVDRELKTYLRVIAKGDNYSFLEKLVSISGVGVTPVSFDSYVSPVPTFESTEKPPVQHNLQAIYIVVSVVAAVLILFSAVGFVLYRRSRGPQSLITDESGYDVNINRTSSNQVIGEDFCNKQLSEMKVIEEPVYVNVEHATDKMDQRGATDHRGNIYANIDYCR